MQNYLPRDLTNLIREYISNPKQNYEKVLEEMKIYNKPDKYENIVSMKDGITRVYRLRYNNYAGIRSVLKANSAQQNLKSVVRDDKWVTIVTAF